MAEQDPKLTEAIAFFEQMLETMPDDRTSLEFLSVAYGEINALDKQLDCMSRLAEMLIREGEIDNASVLLEKIKAFNTPTSNAIATVLESSIQAAAESGVTSNATTSEDSISHVFTPPPTEPDPAEAIDTAPINPKEMIKTWTESSINAEMSVIWFLSESETIPKDICTAIARLITDNPITDKPFLVSAITFLDEQAPTFTPMAFDALQRHSNLPPVPIEMFDIPKSIVELLPEEFIRIKGVIPFQKINDVLIVGLLNPLSEQLQNDVIALAGMKCQFVLISPHSYRTVMNKILPEQIIN